MSKKKILIIDDEKGFSEMVGINLEAAGDYEVEIQTDPNEALSTALDYRPDLILLDVIMGKKEGPDVAIELKNNSVLKETPVVFLTATVTKEEVDAQDGVIGGHPFVAKPSSLETLLSVIEKNLRVI